MIWRIEFDRAALREFEKLDRLARSRILEFLTERVCTRADPRSLGRPLRGSALGEFWRYRVGDYRIIARIVDEEQLILVIQVGHRREIYR
jgi:mRNA interferase RelE/StbE